MAETFGSKLTQMREDLVSIVNRMNVDQSYEAAQAAQLALVAVADVGDKLEELFGDLDDHPWDWKPGDDDG